MLGNHPERLEFAPEPAMPVVLNGRIMQPDETDEWTLQLNEKQAITLNLAAASLGSPLDAGLSIHDAEGKQLATNDDRATGQPDPLLTFTAPKAGAYTVRVRDRFRSRGGPAFAYRLTAAPATQPDFKLTLAAAHYNVTRDPEGGLEDNRAEIERLSEIDAEVSAAKAVPENRHRRRAHPRIDHHLHMLHQGQDAKRQGGARTPRRFQRRSPFGIRGLAEKRDRTQRPHRDQRQGSEFGIHRAGQHAH